MNERDLMDPAGATATDLWDWLLACLDCGEQHHLHNQQCECGRPIPGGTAARTWAAEDGHAYRQRWRWATGGDMHRLRELWGAEQRPPTSDA